MRPDAATFSPLICADTSINTDLTDDLTDGQGVTADRKHATSGPAQRTDLHTSVKTLLQQVAELHTRCDRLEAVKIELAEELRAAVQTDIPEEEVGAAENHHLTVYASSESTKGEELHQHRSGVGHQRLTPLQLIQRFRRSFLR